MSDLTFVALQGIEGQEKTYSARLTWAELANHFDFEPTDKNPEVKRQRDLAPSRSSSIFEYLKKNKDTFVFPQLMAICENVEIISVLNEHAVEMKLAKESWRYLADGQCRLSCIKRAVEEMPEMASQTVDVKFILDRGLQGNRQITADINKSPMRLPASQLINFDRKNPFNQLVIGILGQFPVIKEQIEFEKASIKKGTNKRYTLNQFKSFIKLYTGLSDRSFEKLIEAEQGREKVQNSVIEYLKGLSKHTCIFKPSESVVDTVLPSAVFIEGLALAGKALLFLFAETGTIDWSPLRHLSALDYRVDAVEWKGRCINAQGKFVAKVFNKKAVAGYLIMNMGIPMPEDLANTERELKMSRNQLSLLDEPMKVAS